MRVKRKERNGGGKVVPPSLVCPRHAVVLSIPCSLYRAHSELSFVPVVARFCGHLFWRRFELSMRCMIVIAGSFWRSLFFRRTTVSRRAHFLFLSLFKAGLWSWRNHRCTRYSSDWILIKSWLSISSGIDEDICDSKCSTKPTLHCPRFTLFPY